jgi:glutamine synthetase
LKQEESSDQDAAQLNTWLDNHAVTEVECLVPDLSGVARGKIMPASKFRTERISRLPEGIFIQTITGEWTDETGDLVDPAEIDMILKPDPSTIRIVPWAAEPTAQVIHDCFYPNGEPVGLAPRQVLKRILERYRERGWQPVVAPELEFFLVKKNIDPDYPLEPPIGRSGRAESARQSYSIDAVNEFDPITDDIYEFCEAQHLEIDTLIHESGAAQLEINFRHGDPLELADQAFLFKRTVREVALRHEVYATFMAKPMDHEPGSAMHIHQSVLDIDSGKNIFAEPDARENRAFLAHIGGLQKYLPAAMPFFAPNVNSYRRLARWESAPIHVQWGFDNRTAGFRVPASDPSERRVENRVAGADVNPYLAIALSLACGYLGMIEDLTPSVPLATSAYEHPYGLPRTLEESLRLLDDCSVLKELLGERFVRAYSAVKRWEYETFFRVISSWEREYLLLNV